MLPNPFHARFVGPGVLPEVRPPASAEPTTFAAWRQLYLEALPVAAAVVGVDAGGIVPLAGNALFKRIAAGSASGTGPIAHPEVARCLAAAGADDWAGETIAWRDSNKVDSRHFAINLAAIGHAPTGEKLILVTFVDRTVEVRTARSLRSEMLTDSLTGLPNRMGFIDRVEQRFIADRPQSYAIVVIDLARFARVNECIGPLGGDELIITVARRLMSTLRGYDQLGRTGANEFAMVIRIEEEGDVLKVVGRIQDVLATPCRLSDFEIKVDCAIGCALAGTEIVEPEQLLRFAQVALKGAKVSGKAEFYQPATLEVSRRRFMLETELRRAIERDQLSMAFQPLISFDTGRIVGFEALARWNHPDTGIVHPTEFIAVAEESGLIVPLGRWALDRALKTLSAWDQAEGRELPIYLAVNLSPIQLARDDVPAAVGATLAHRRIAGKRLAIELTESAIVADPERAMRILGALKACDAMVSMDDFGTGFSNLASLQRLPIDTLKIDRSFVDGMVMDPDKVAIIGAIQSLATALGMATTAEGIETQEQADRLKAIGCSIGQGYLYASPLDPDSALAFAKASLAR